ncbi:MAG TPA: DNA repair protein RadC [Rhodocyclaceae bacterium]|nr:DNA repair protein RadC [Burkholderiaceae bacterium]HRP74531.1 DNA repair protein RadC [Rhodocyclaceae bacterium]
MNTATAVRSEDHAAYSPTTPTTTNLTDADRFAIDLACRAIDKLFERGGAMSDPTAAGAYFKLKLAVEPREAFAVMYLDARHHLINFRCEFYGTIDGAEVHPREIVRQALICNAAAVIVGHNHPSGNPEPSAADRAVTTRLKQALSLVDVRLLDHFVVGEGSPVSLAARGWV